jgi:hypothetical protein
MNKHLLPPQIDDKWRQPEMMPRLQALVNRMAELYQTGLRACHYAEEFILQRIQTLGHRERAARQVAD